MSFGEDEEILQDFLVEAGEILDQLSEQLVDLEQSPSDHELLNAIFRGFHTVKGGAGFLQLDPMVECCHVTENLFDILRNGKRAVTPELMDVALQALDTVNSQFQQISQGQTVIDRASPELIDKLNRLVACEDLVNTPTNEPSPSAPSAKPASPGILDISDDEYESMLDAISDSPTAPSTSADVSSTEKKAGNAGDEITEDEFEELLDQLHGSGKGPSAQQKATVESVGNVIQKDGDEITEEEFEALLDQLHGAHKPPGAQSAPAPKTPGATPASGGSDLISDDEFESLLDQLHGHGKGPSAGGPSTTQKASAAADPTIAKGDAKKGEENKSAQQPNPTPQHKTPTPASSEDSAIKVPKPRDAHPNPQTPTAETTVRVDTQRLDDIMNMVGELVLVRNRLVRLGLDTSDEALSKAVANLDVVTADLQSSVMKTRMQPIKKVFGRFPRVVRDLARNLRKEINLELVGEETDLDKNLVEALADPLVHLVRNSVDHGIELPAERESVGKPRVGKIVLSAEQEGDHILLIISDDGAGMDPEKLRRKAVEKGILEEDAAARLSDVEAFNLIFAPGFSTKVEVSDVSGRGVGMDVVKTKITQLNGSISIESKEGSGTRIIIKVPLTLAIMPTLMIMLGKQCFALPLVSVNEIFQMDLTKAHVVDGQECVTIRQKAIPIFHLKRWLVKTGQPSSMKEAHVVIVTVGTRKVGFVVDQLIGQEEVVIKPLGKMLHGTPGMAGATITGDGTIALILDVPSLLKRYAGGI